MRNEKNMNGESEIGFGRGDVLPGVCAAAAGVLLLVVGFLLGLEARGADAEVTKDTLFGDVDGTKTTVGEVVEASISESDPKFTAWKTGRRISLGDFTSVYSDDSLALGVNATVTKYAFDSIAIKGTTDAPYAIAIGNASEASADDSLALGSTANAMGDSSIAIGYGAYAGADDSIAIGKNACVYENGAIGFSASPANFFLSSYYIRGSTSNFSRTLQSYLDEWRDWTNSTELAIGKGASATNNQGIAISGLAYGKYAIAIGGDGEAYPGNTKALASEKYAVCIGANTKATGVGSVVVGANCKASGYDATSINGNASGMRSIALGSGSEATKDTSIAAGYVSKASGYSSIAAGFISKASGDNSIAVGYDSKASGDNSIAVGYYSRAIGDYSIALGRVVKAGTSCTAINGDAYGRGSTAIGYSSTATNYSVAVGYGAKAHGSFSVAIGDGSPTGPLVYEVSTNVTTTVTEIPLDDGSVSNAVVEVTEIVTNSSATAVGYAKAAGIHSLALGYMAYAPAEAMGLAYSPDRIYLCSSNTVKNAGATARSLQSYLRYSFRSPSFEEVSIPQTDADGVETSVVTTNGVTCADGYIYDVAVTNGAEGVYFMLPEYASHSQDFIVRLACSDTNGTQIAGWGEYDAPGPAEVDWPNGDLMTTGSLKGTNYVTFTQTGANRWRISCYPANKEK